MNQAAAYFFGGWLVDPSLNLVSKDQVHCGLVPGAMNSLTYLLDRPDRTISAEEILGSVWKDRVVDTGVVAKVVCQIRSSLNDSPKNAKYIKTIHRRGYRTVALVRPLNEEQLRSVNAQSEQGQFDVAEWILTSASDEPRSLNPKARAPEPILNQTFDFNRLAISNPEVNEILSKAMGSVEQLTQLERNRFNALANVLFFGIQKTFYSLTAKEIKSAVWQGQVLSLRVILANPGFRHRWDQLKPFLGGSFCDFIDSDVLPE